MESRQRLLVTGASGFLGWNICRSAAERYQVYGVYHRHRFTASGVTPVACDLTDTDAAAKLFSDLRPDAIIHAAAAADPNYCEQHPDTSAIINIHAAATIARLSNSYSIPCAFTSTDLVFDGTAAPYRENDQPCPLNRYGRQKLEAERAMLKSHDKMIICRMPLMYGDAPPGATSFIHPMLNNIRSGKPLTLFTDEYRTPLSARDAAAGLLLAIETAPPGILHLGGPQRLSRYEIGCILSSAAEISAIINRAVQKDIQMSAPRAADVSLNSAKARALGFNPAIFEQELRLLHCVSTY